MSANSTPRVDRLSILLLCLEWIVLGSCHFTFLAATEAEIPRIIPFKTFFAVATGMIEVTTGILILFPRTRKFAALTSLSLLFIVIPSMYSMLASDAAIPGNEAWRNFVRVLLVPNNVFLALCAIHLLYSRESWMISPSEVFETVLSYQRKPANGAATPLVASVMLIANAAGFLVILRSPSNHSSAMLWAMMRLAIGALVGFLFGVPRINLDAEKEKALRTNSNIEVVSDWLTKIIVGVSLVEFRKIGKFLTDISSELGQSFAPQLGAESFAKALIIYFFVAGAIQGYLLTRMYLGGEFQH